MAAWATASWAHAEQWFWPWGFRWARGYRWKRLWRVAPQGHRFGVHAVLWQPTSGHSSSRCCSLSWEPWWVDLGALALHAGSGRRFSAGGSPWLCLAARPHAKRGAS